jgi:uncharacterized membrane protein YoaK (UPF0700 family)
LSRPRAAQTPSSAADPAATRLRDTLVVILTLATGATDVMAITRLGAVLASVMTANLVFLGLAAAQRSAALAGHVAVAIAAFIGGAALGSRLAHQRRDGEPVWPVRVTRALAVEVLFMLLLAAGWETSQGRPAGILQVALLFLAAGCMGIQSGAVAGLGVPGLSSTYMTGTLTMLLAGLTVNRRLEVRSGLTLTALIVGAAACGILVAAAPPFAPLVPLAVLVGVAAAAEWARRSPAGRRLRPDRPAGRSGA